MPPRKKPTQKPAGTSAGDAKPQQDRHAKKRIGVNVPEDWHAVMRKLASKKKMPVLWFLLDMTKREADEQGIETPTTPWDEEEEAT